MVTKTFDLTIQFYQTNVGGRLIKLPLVQVNLIRPNGSSVALPLLFDTGASVTTLRADHYSLLGLNSWDEGQAINVGTAGGTAINYQYQATLEVFGKRISCPINLAQIPLHPLFSGLLGRDTIFEQFGFGFWEKDNELYITGDP
jgi:hypothetical protein